MKTDNLIYVLDACSLIAFLGDENGSQEVLKILTASLEGKCIVTVHSINLCEVYCNIYKCSGLENAQKLWTELDKLPINIMSSCNQNLLELAGEFKVKNKISFADSFVLGLAKLLNATVVTSDHHEFDPIDQNKTLNFHWIR